jgi:phage shock protein A
LKESARQRDGEFIRRREDAKMANPFVKGWKYLMALFGSKIDEYADPKVQIQQAIEDAQRQHQALLQQAAAVIGNQRQLEMKLSRQLTEVENMQANARQALTLSERSRATGDAAKANDYEQTAQTFAAQLVAAESGLLDLKSLHDQALGAAQQARDAVRNNEMLLKQRLAERTKLLSQLEQAKMQESVAKSLESVGTLSAPGTTPTLDEVRDKIEKRYAVALGRADLAQGSVEGRRLEVQKATLDMAGSARLEEIRASMQAELTSGSSATQKAVTSGDPIEQLEAAPEPEKEQA